MAWNASLRLAYRRAGPRTVLDFEHDGPLRVLQSLYPEGEAVCHNVLVHPPGGLVGGDTLDVQVQVAEGAHALVSTPGATRFYRCKHTPATQQVHLHLEPGARLEWLPLETLAYPGCMARNRLSFDLGAGAELLAWDVTALGLPGSGQAFDHGWIEQRLHWPGQWLEHGRLDASDARLLHSPLGLGGQRCMATLVLATGSPWPTPRCQALLDHWRATLATAPGGVAGAATAPSPRVMLVRALAPMAEPLMVLLQALWKDTRVHAWSMPARAPRIWQV
jgi:urease accessory protein